MIPDHLEIASFFDLELRVLVGAEKYGIEMVQEAILLIIMICHGRITLQSRGSKELVSWQFKKKNQLSWQVSLFDV